MVALAISLFTIWLLVANLSTWTIVVAVFSIYRVINLRRVIQSRIHVSHLYHTSRQAELWLVGLQFLTIVISLSIQPWDWALMTWWYGLAVLEVAGITLLFAAFLRHLKTIRPIEGKPIADKDLPTVTIAIPARNETTELHACLESLLANNYPKLEILVLDDCSQNKRTPEIIREFAQAGVRFVAGKEPPKQWLAKNFAYQQLLEASNGDVLLFCGVDTRFKPDSIRALIMQLEKRKKVMVSVLPINQLGDKRIASLIIQPVRYAWEVALPRRMLGRPPVLSTCWLITREALEATGGFAAARRTVVPESYFARETARFGDAYSFLHATPNMFVVSHKSLEEQKSTAIRTRYPQLHRRPELAALVSLLSFALFVWPVALLLVALSTATWPLVLLVTLSVVLSAVLYGLLVQLTYRTLSLRAFFIAPIAAIYDIALLNYSMWQYEFSTVLWKDRNICLPVMQVSAHGSQDLAQK